MQEENMGDMKSFFEPASVALVGATERTGAVGRTVLENLLLGKDKRPVYPVNPKQESLLGTKCYSSLSAIPEVPELVVIATNARMVSELVEESGKIGTKNIIIISSGFKEIGEEGKEREKAISETARRYGIRIIGPNCLGIIRPGAGLNATFGNRMPKPGHIAFLSQSGALGTAVLDWAVSRDIGFSTFVSLGSMLDVDFGELIDYLGEDAQTQSILIYLESLGNSTENSRKFISAARGFARNKPIIIIKPGKFDESVRAARSHTGAMLSDDAYYDAAFDRAGTVRVEEIEDLFNCAAILNTEKLPRAPRLAIVTNAGGPAVLATDSLISRGGKLADLSTGTMQKLNEILPASWSHSNPVDILGDADETRYLTAIEIVLNDENIDGAVIIYTPQGLAKPVDLAKAIIKQAKKASKPVVTVMMGSDDVAKARKLFYDNKIPTYEFPEKAIRTYMYMYQYARHLDELYEVPVDMPLNLGAPKNYLKILIRNALRAGRTLLSEEDSKKLLSTYGIEVTTPYLARSPDDAVRVAAGIGYPLVMKISSPDISHKSDVGGVILNIASDKQVQAAYLEMTASIKQKLPEARIEGVTLQRMVDDHSYELILGSKKDPTLGPVILFGLGGTEAEYFRDIAVGLPPLNQKLARIVIEKTRIYQMLSKGFRNKPPVDLRLVDETMVKISNLIIDFPEIQELDINPLVVSGGRIIALDARIILDAALMPGAELYSHLIISPYPTRYIQPWRCVDGRSVVLRPIRPEDEPLERELLAGLSPESSRFRFFHIIRDITHDMLSRFCNIDYGREMAIIAEYSADGKRRNVGVGRIIIQGESAEFAILVADDFQNAGLGLKISDMLIGVAEEKNLKNIYGIVLNDNRNMLNLSQKLGFTIQRLSQDESRIELELNAR
jgi:acetyltransferase